LKTFRSVNNIATATEEELEKQIGKSKARLVWNHFHKNLAENGIDSNDEPLKN